MTKPLGNEDLSDKVGERVIDKPELPVGGITNGNDVLTSHQARGRPGPGIGGSSTPQWRQRRGPTSASSQASTSSRR